MQGLPIEIYWKPPRPTSPDWGDPDTVSVWISVQKLDAAWQLSTGDYIGAGGTGAAIEDRYNEFGEWIISTGGREHVEMPILGLDEDSVSFTDGRHRFAWLRDHGVLAIRIEVESEQQKEFETHFGSADRHSIITSFDEGTFD